MSASITTDISNYEARGYGDLGHKMKALTWQGKNSVKVVDTARPKIIDEGDVILKVTGSTICGSDLHLFHEAIPDLQKGDILGHEFCGVIASVGPVVKKVKACLATPTSRGGFAGGQAEYVRVPYGDVNLLQLPDDVPDEKGLYLSDVLGTSWNAVVDTGIEKGDTVAIWGAGPIGQMAAEFSFFNGADRVILIDGGLGKWRLDFVKKILPKLETIEYTNLPKGESVTSTLKRMCDGRGPDVAIECAAGEYTKGWAHYFERLLGMETDTPELLNEMITSVRGFGRCGVTGVYAGYCNHFNIGSMMETGIHLAGNGQAPVQKYWNDLLKYIQQEKIHPLHMVTHRYKLEDMETVYDLFNKRNPGMQKVFVQTKFSAPPSPGAPSLTVL
ncbi:hypothetical protein N7448_002018 [Penicillium atrosanguineum]|nr:hypothetical protein N7526_006466 [Penicillium atrosanguineum]KAJ5144626.1 hypothetical protein N7448_002018 [Penicillium atrosanguineum]